MKKILSILLMILVLLPLTACKSSINVIEKEVNNKDGSFANKTIILHTNDVHGKIEGYSYIPPLKKHLEDEGANVLVVDAGDFSSGSIYVSSSKGESAITLMNEAGYDIVGLGNHEFDFSYDKLKDNLANATFKVLCSNVLENNKTIFDSETIVKIGDLKIGFFALETPETLTKANPDLVKGLDFLMLDDLYKVAQSEIDKLKKEADLIVCISHLGVSDESLGNRSYDLFNNTDGIDIIIDGHSHTVMINGENGEPIQSTGTEFENIGSIVIDNKTKEIVKHELIPTNDLEQDSEVLATINNVIQTVDDEYAKVFAKTEVDLNGEKADNRSKETNLGDLVADAIIWTAKNENEIKVDEDHVVGIVNGGGIRASINKGDVSKKDVFNVLPFGNTISINYVSGKELLEALEASTFSTPESVGGFPQISGMKIAIDTNKTYDAGDLYPDSTYACPKSINRVTIKEVNGKPFNENDTYAVITSNFVSSGGDTYYVFKNSKINGNAIDTPVTLDSSLANYISAALKGVVGQEYAKPQERIDIIK